MPAAWLKRNLQLTTYNLQLLLVVGCLLLVAIPQNTYAIIGIDEPLIPCGTEIETTGGITQIKNPCTFCHFFVLIQNIYNFLMFVIVPPVAVVMIAIGGFFWLTAAGSPGRVQTGHKIILSVLTGLVIMYVAWLVISFGISLIAKDIGIYRPSVWYDPGSWFELECGSGVNIFYLCSPRDDSCFVAGNCDLYDTNADCKNDCPSPNGCVPIELEPPEEGISLTMSRTEVPDKEAAILIWSLGKDSNGDDIDKASCAFSANPNDPDAISQTLTDKVKDVGSGSHILEGFKEAGSHSYTLTCGSLAKTISLTVTECQASDILVHWTDTSGNEVSSVNVGARVAAVLDYDAIKCKNRPAVISIDNFGGGLTALPMLDGSGQWSQEYTTSSANDCPATGNSGTITLNGAVANPSGSVVSGSDSLQVQNCDFAP